MDSNIGKKDFYCPVMGKKLAIIYENGNMEFLCKGCKHKCIWSVPVKDVLIKNIELFGELKPIRNISA